MRRATSIVFILLILRALVVPSPTVTTIYFVKNGGNDALAGTSDATAWATLAHASTVAFLAGDVIELKRGSVFNEKLTINRSGSVGIPIKFQSYGSGANPVISGFTTVSGWTNTGGNKWQSTAVVSTLPTCNMVLINGVNTAMGRFPNDGSYIVYQDTFRTNPAANPTPAHIVCSGLNSTTTDWTGAEMVSRKIPWVWDRDVITSHVGTTLNYVNTSTYPGTPGFGLFIQNDIRTLDVQNEWYYSPTTKKITIFSTSAPTGVQITAIDTLINIPTRANITIDGIDIIGANKVSIAAISSVNLTVQNCNITYSGQEGFSAARNGGSTSANLIFQNNTVKYCNNNAFYIQSQFTSAYIGHNTFIGNAMIIGQGGSGSTGDQSVAIQTRANSTVIEFNRVDSTGYCGIDFQNDSGIVRNNYVTYSLLNKSDGGGIYTFAKNHGSAWHGMKIYNNIVLYSMGFPPGTNTATYFQGEGIYCDDKSGNIEVYGNTCAHNTFAGMLCHNTTSMNIHDNTFYDNGSGPPGFNNAGTLFISNDSSNPVRTTTFKHNIIASKLSTSFVAYFSTSVTDINLFGSASTIDSNVWARPIDDNITFRGKQSGNPQWTLAQWVTFSGFDSHSTKSPKAITSTDSLRFEYNATNSPVTVTLDAVYIDMKNVSYGTGSITLAPWGSAVLIRNGSLPVIIPGTKSRWWISRVKKFFQ